MQRPFKVSGHPASVHWHWLSCSYLTGKASKVSEWKEIWSSRQRRRTVRCFTYNISACSCSIWQSSWPVHAQRRVCNGIFSVFLNWCLILFAYSTAWIHIHQFSSEGTENNSAWFTVGRGISHCNSSRRCVWHWIRWWGGLIFTFVFSDINHLVKSRTKTGQRKKR